MNKQIEILNKQATMINSKIEELSLISNSIDEISTTQKDQEILVPLGPGVLIRTSLKEPREILMNVGSDVVVMKSYSDSKKIIETQISELMSALKELEIEIEVMTNNLDSIKQDLRNSNE